MNNTDGEPLEFLNELNKKGVKKVKKELGIK